MHVCLDVVVYRNFDDHQWIHVSICIYIYKYLLRPSGPLAASIEFAISSPTAFFVHASGPIDSVKNDKAVRHE